MNTKDEILQALAGQPAAVPPAAVFTQSATMDLMDRTGCSWPAAHTDPAQMAGLALGISRFCGMHSARVPFCVSAEAERLGCTVRMGKHNAAPAVTGSPYRRGEGFAEVPDLMSPSEFTAAGRTRTAVEAVDRLHREHGEDLAVIAGVTGPLTVTTHLLGAEAMLIAMVAAPDRVLAWQRALQPLMAAYVRELADAGADVIQLSEGSGSPDLISPDDFDRFAGNYLRGLTRVPGAYTSLHICGEVAPIIRKMTATGVDAVSLDCHVEPREAVHLVGGRAALIGNVGPVRSLMTGTPEDVQRDARDCAEAGFSIIAPGCGVPISAPTANLRALAAYARPQRPSVKKKAAGGPAADVFS